MGRRMVSRVVLLEEWEYNREGKVIQLNVLPIGKIGKEKI